MFSATKPAKFLVCEMTSSLGIEAWPFDDGTGQDLWFINQNPYRWEIEISVIPQNHSSHLTRNPFQYTGLDIKIGDWISGTGNGVALKIISITQKSDTFVKCIIEDVDRFNTFHDPTGNGIGIFPLGKAVVFELGGDGLPILLPLPGAGILSQNFAADLISRFRINNPTRRFRFEQTNHGFVEGDELVINKTTGLFEKSSSSNLNIVGRVVEVESGPNTFLLDPITKIREDILPPLPGNVGDVIYYDPLNPGALTNIFPGKGAKAAYIKLSNSIPAQVTGTIGNPTTIINNILEINDIEVVFTTDPNSDNIAELADVVNDINLLNSQHGVMASSIISPTSVIGTVPNPIEDINSGPITFTINGILVSLVTDVNGFGFPGIDDIIQDINGLSGLHGVNASNNNGFLELTEVNGNAITIVDVDPPTGGAIGFRKPFKEATGLVDAPASTTFKLSLSANNGQQILLRNKFGTPMLDLGIFSVENGKLPLGLIVEQSSKVTESFVVPDIPSRDALNVGVGDTVFVINKGDGEWGGYLYDGTSFILINTEESARTDSRSLSVDITNTSPLQTVIGEVSSGSRVSPVTIEVIIPFDSAPTISVGDAGQSDRLFENANVDLTTIGTYVSTPAFQYTGGTDTDIIVTFSSAGATQGLARVTITYS